MRLLSLSWDDSLTGASWVIEPRRGSWQPPASADDATEKRFKAEMDALEAAVRDGSLNTVLDSLGPLLPDVDRRERQRIGMLEAHFVDVKVKDAGRVRSFLDLAFGEPHITDA